MYDMLTREDYRDKHNRRKQKYNRIGVAFEGRKGGMNCQPYPGIAIVGPFIIRERTEKPSRPGRRRAGERRRRGCGR